MVQDAHGVVYAVSEILGYQWAPLLDVARPLGSPSRLSGLDDWLWVEVVGMPKHHVMELSDHSHVEMVVCLNHPSDHPLV